VARDGRRARRRFRARARVQPGEHGDRCCGRRAGRGAGAQRARPWDLGAGRLIRPFDVALKLPYSYWIVCPKPTASLPKIATFRDWLLSEAAADARRIERASPQRGVARKARR